MNHIANKLVACACSIALVAGLAPSAALAEDGLRAGEAKAAALSQRARAIDGNADAFDDDSIIVVYRDGAAPSRKASRGISAQSVSIAGIPDATAELLSRESGTPGGGAALVVDVPDGVTVGQAVAAAEADPDIVLAQPNFLYYPHATFEGDAAPASAEGAAQAYSGEYPLPDDPIAGVAENDTSQYPSNPNQWWIHAVDAPRAWSMAHGSDNPVAVAVLDTGVIFEHEDLKANLLADYAYDAYLDEKLTESIDNDEMGHGSHVAGIVAAEADNGLGIAGVSYNANVLPIRVFHLGYSSYYGYETAQCSDEDLIRAYDYLLSDRDGNGKTVAQETNTHVVNMSLGGYLQDAVDSGEDPDEAYDYLFEDKIEQAEAAGILTVASAGNGDEYGNPRTDASYPSDYKAVMSVIALKTETERTSWSDHNAMKNIAAPGNNVYSTYWRSNSDYRFMSGTSMASPIVAGCAALLWAYDPGLTVRDVKDALYNTADDLGAEGFDEYYGWGRVNLGGALASLGTATIGAANTTMTRTTSQQLSAGERANANARHTWKWAVDDPTVARISSTGLLTAVSPGKVVVTVTATDDAGIEGKRTVEVVDLSIAGDVVASANPVQNTIALAWNEAEAATSYQILRATAAAGSTSEPGAFSELGTFAASQLAQAGTVGYLDTTAEAGVLYWYRVVPIGSLDGVAVKGSATVSNRCFYTDKAALKVNLDKAEALLDTTVTSADGTDIAADAFWTTPSARADLSRALNDAYGAYMSGTMLQVRVDAVNQALADAIAAFQAVRSPGLKEPERQREDEQPSAPLDDGAGMGQEDTAPDAQPAAPESPAADATTDTPHEAAPEPEPAPAAPAASGTGANAPAAEGASASSGAAGTAATSGASGSAASAEAAPGATSGTAGETAPGAATPAAATSPAEALPAAAGAGAAKSANTMVAKGKTVKVAYSKKKARTVSAKKAYRIAKANGKVTFKKAAGKKWFSVNARSGKLTVAKGAKRGTYTVKVKVRAAGDEAHKPVSKTVKVKVKVR